LWFGTVSVICSSISDAQDLPVECGTVPKHGIASLRQRVQGRRCVRVDPVCRLLMTVSGASALASIALRSPSTPRRFSRSRGGGAHFGLTPRHSSDELIYQGRISKRRDPEAPALLLAG
jgi:transposase